MFFPQPVSTLSLDQGEGNNSGNEAGQYASASSKQIALKDALEAASRLVAAKALIQVEKKIKNARAYQAAGIYGLLRTHERLDAGEPTQITANFDIYVVVASDILAAKLSQALIDGEKAMDITPSRDDKPTQDDR